MHDTFSVNHCLRILLIFVSRRFHSMLTKLIIYYCRCFPFCAVPSTEPFSFAFKVEDSRVTNRNIFHLWGTEGYSKQFSFENRFWIKNIDHILNSY